jgi:ABC-type polysaccharide/polyol phosphate export permease
MLGPLWIVLSTGVWFMAMGFVMANLFHQKLEDYLPFLVSGLLIWTLISTSIAESSQVLVASSPLIHSFPIPIFTHYIRFVLRNGIIFLHNFIVLAIVLLIYPPQVTMATWLTIPALALDFFILMGLAIFLSLANLRYRDTHLAIASAMQILPFVTPLFWNRSMLENHRWIADVNPFYHMVEVVRSPMLGKAPDLLSWEVTGGLAFVLMLSSCFLFTRYRHRIIFWL